MYEYCKSESIKISWKLKAMNNLEMNIWNIWKSRRNGNPSIMWTWKILSAVILKSIESNMEQYVKSETLQLWEFKILNRVKNIRNPENLKRWNKLSINNATERTKFWSFRVSENLKNLKSGNIFKLHIWIIWTFRKSWKLENHQKHENTHLLNKRNPEPWKNNLRNEKT